MVSNIDDFEDNDGKAVDTKSYEVGYGKPPVKHRFRPGQSGNPKGRPKGKHHLPIMMHKALNKALQTKVNTTINGELTQIAVVDSLALKAATDPLKGGSPRLLEFMTAMAIKAEDKKVEREERRNKAVRQQANALPNYKIKIEFVEPPDRAAAVSGPQKIAASDQSRLIEGPPCIEGDFKSI